VNGPTAQNQPSGHPWLDAATRVVIQVGFPIVVAGALLWWLLGQFTRDIHAIAYQMQDNAVQIAKFVDMQKDQLAEMKEHTRELREQTNIMKGIATQQRESRP